MYHTRRRPSSRARARDRAVRHSLPQRPTSSFVSSRDARISSQSPPPPLAPQVRPSHASRRASHRIASHRIASIGCAFRSRSAARSSSSSSASLARLASRARSIPRVGDDWKNIYPSARAMCAMCASRTPSRGARANPSIHRWGGGAHRIGRGSDVARWVRDARRAVDRAGMDGNEWVRAR